MTELAKANPFTAELLESSKKTWGELVQRSCPFYQHKGLPVEEGDHGWDDHTYRPWVEDRFAEQQVNDIDIVSLDRGAINIETLRTIIELDIGCFCDLAR